jgi:hypothetical protein
VRNPRPPSPRAAHTFPPPRTESAVREGRGEGRFLRRRSHHEVTKGTKKSRGSATDTHRCRPMKTAAPRAVPVIGAHRWTSVAHNPSRAPVREAGRRAASPREPAVTTGELKVTVRESAVTPNVPPATPGESPTTLSVSAVTLRDFPVTPGEPPTTLNDSLTTPNDLLTTPNGAFTTLNDSLTTPSASAASPGGLTGRGPDGGGAVCRRPPVKDDAAAPGEPFKPPM